MKAAGREEGRGPTARRPSPTGRERGGGLHVPSAALRHSHAPAQGLSRALQSRRFLTFSKKTD